MIYDILYKTLINQKPLRISFDKIDGIIRTFHRTTYLTLFGSEKYEAIYHKIRYLFNTKLDKSICHAMIHIESVFNKDTIHYYYRIFLGKYSYQLAKNNHNFFFIV